MSTTDRQNTNTQKEPQFTEFIYTFHMPLFFLVAGFLFNYTKYSRDFCGFVKKKFKRLAVPYLVGSLVIFFSLLVFPWPPLRRGGGEARRPADAVYRRFLRDGH